MPITPSEARKKKKDYLEGASWIPKVVLDSFDEMIVDKLEDGQARFSVPSIVKLIMSKDGHPMRNDLFDKKMLNVEDYYRKAGWKVTFDKADYNSSSDDFFIFESKK